MENLIELSVVSINWRDIIDRERPIINFNKLTTLKLDGCSFNNGSWPNLSEKIPFVENLHLDDLFPSRNGRHWHEIGLDWILPFPLLHLKKLEFVGAQSICNNVFVDKLIECPQLRQVHLNLDQRSTDEESLVRLANMNIDLKMKVRLYSYDAAIFDSSSRFKIVSGFHERVESFELYIRQDWNELFSTALEDVVDKCSNLTSFGIDAPRFPNQPQIEFKETNRFNAALLRFFSPERAQQLKGLRLIGNFDEKVLLAVFDNCLNLDRLDIRRCPNLRDQHLKDWVSRGGGKLANFVMDECNNVTSEGIISILAKSAEGLLRYDIGRNQGNSGRSWKTVMLNHCPNAVPASNGLKLGPNE